MVISRPTQLERRRAARLLESRAAVRRIVGLIIDNSFDRSGAAIYLMEVS